MRCDCDKQVRDVLLDSLVDLCRDPSLLPSMYVNYDCDLEGSNLFERICKFLARSAFPYSGVLTSVHTQSIEGLQAVIAGTAHLAQCSSAAYCVFLPAQMCTALRDVLRAPLPAVLLPAPLMRWAAGPPRE